MMNAYRVIVLDDDAGLANDWVNMVTSIRGIFDKIPGLDIKPMPVSQFKSELGILRGRRSGKNTSPSAFDGIDILIVDYDLLDVNTESLYVTGEEVAYLVRCFSSCGLIVGMNLIPVNQFDLTLRNHPDSFADVHISSKQIGNSALWGVHANPFTPWSWTPLPQRRMLLSSIAEDLKNNLDKIILDYLSFPVDVVNTLSRTIKEFLGGKLERLTFRMFLKNSETCIRAKDYRRVSSDRLPGIAAARISKWLEDVVLPGQDILVDAPHLVWRYPSLMNGNARSLAGWNSLTKLGVPPSQLPIHRNQINPFLFRRSTWLSRPAWYWKKVSSIKVLPEVALPWSTSVPNFVFCEDRSEFRKTNKCGEFVSETESPYARRYFSRVPGIAYDQARISKS